MRSKKERQGLVVCFAIVVWLIANNTNREISRLGYVADSNESEITVLAEKLENIDDSLNFPGQGFEEVREAAQSNEADIGELQTEVERVEEAIDEIELKLDEMKSELDELYLR